jgi:putative ABC transport system substrate-binding protein
MRRREFIAALSGAAAWPMRARAQQTEQMRSLGALMNLSETDEESRLYASAFLQSLREAGWVEGRNIRLHFRWGAGNSERYDRFAAELVALAPDVILASNSSIVRALQKVTSTIPIVFAGGTDPVGGGVVASLSHPGRNVTGFSSFEFSMTGKWLELLKEVAPHVTRVAVLHNPSAAASVGQLRALETAAPSFKVRLIPVDSRETAVIEQEIAAFAQESNGGIVAVSNASISEHREQIIALATQFRLPAIYPFRYFAHAGGLVSYGPDRVDPYRRAAGYVDRILRGEKPADLPVQEPVKYELALNLRTAKALGLSLPQSLLARADDVIE